MPDLVRVRLLLARNDGDTVSVLGAIDEEAWNHYNATDERDWLYDCGADDFNETRQAWAVFPADRLAAVFNTVTVEGNVEAGE